MITHHASSLISLIFVTLTHLTHDLTQLKLSLPHSVFCIFLYLTLTHNLALTALKKFFSLILTMSEVRLVFFFFFPSQSGPCPLNSASRRLGFLIGFCHFDSNFHFSRLHQVIINILFFFMILITWFWLWSFYLLYFFFFFHFSDS